MSKRCLLALLLAGLTSLAAGAEAHGTDRPGHDPAVVQIVPGQHLPRLYREVALWPFAGEVLGHDHATPRALRKTPWHYHPQSSCAPPYCLPSYHRHRLKAASRPPMPLGLILQRLELHEYHAFGAILLDGPDYWIDARSRYGQPVRLIVSSASGQIRGLVILPQQ